MTWQINFIFFLIVKYYSCYFILLYSSWQKGAIENANGLVRQYIPKSAAFSNFSQQKITKFTEKINERPRKKLNFSTPKECFYKNIS